MLNRRNFLGALLAPPILTSEIGAGPKPALAAGPPAAAPSSPVPWPDENDPAYWDRIRDQFYIPREEAFFNTGTLGATPRPVLERVIEDMRTLQITITRWDYTQRTPNWISGYSPELPIREKMGRLVNANGKDIAIPQNATLGMNFVANGLDLQAGDEVILTNQEHPGGICGWQMRAKREGIVVKQVEIPIPANDPDAIVRLFRQAITPRTRVLAFPHIISGSATVLPAKPLTALAHEHNCLSVIDGAQAVGQIEVDMKAIGCDAYFSSPHKWLLAPPGNGLFYIRPDRQASLWTTLCSSVWDDHEDGLFRFMQYGTGNHSLQVGLDAALDFHFRIGPERVRARIRNLADRLRAGLKQIPGTKVSSPLHPEMAGAVVVYGVEGVPAMNLQDELWTRKSIRVRSQGDVLGVRQSCQIYNNEAEIDATLEVVRALARKA